MHAQAVSYLSGPWVLLAGRDAVVLADVDPAGPVLAALWDAAERGSGVDGLLGVIVREGLRSVPSFAITDGARVLVSGKAGAEVTLIDGQAPQVLSAADAPTWLDRVFEGAESVRLSAEGAPADGPEFPLHSGAALAAAVTIGAAPAGMVPAAPVEAGAPATLATPVEEAPVEEVAPVPASEPVPAVDPVPVAEPTTAADPVPLAKPEPAEAETVAEPVPPSFDHLFGRTDNPPAEPAQGESTRAEPTPAEPTQGEPTTGEPAASTMYPPPHDEAELESAGTELIERLPWQLPPEFQSSPEPVPPPAAAAPPAAASPSAASSHAPSEHTVPPSWFAPDAVKGDTTSRSRLGQSDEVSPPSVLASVCPNRHVSPPHAGVCRVCGQPIPQQDPIRVPRPVLGVINLSTGDMVPLDRDIVLGRAPSVSDSEPSVRPHLVQLASTAQDISRSHLRISLEGWHVQVIDLGSTNGTIVTLPGQQPVRLRAHDPFTIVPGTVLSLADEVTLRYEVTG